MKHCYLILILLLPFCAFADSKADSAWIVNNYTKEEVYIPMRDGKRLYTAVYKPKNVTEKHPILINRTPYSIAPYGADTFKTAWNSHYKEYFKEYYIIVNQDVRGRYMSEGDFEDIRPYNPDKEEDTDIDEASDTYDTIEWLLKHVKGNNGKVGAFGISYPGFYATMTALSHHPAVVAVSPQAPVTEWFLGDDFHHNGAFMLMDGFNFYSSFGKPRPVPTRQGAKGFNGYFSKDNYKFYLETGPLKNFAKLMGDSVAYWKELYAHPNYDEWWQVRNTRAHVQHIPKRVHTLVVGGLFDAEDCYGAWNLYKAIEEKAKNDNKLVMGPWSHGGWARYTGEYLGNVRFGAKNSEWYQKNIEIPFFNYYLKGKGDISKISEANIFFSGANKWEGFEQWPPANMKPKPLYLHPGGKLDWTEPTDTSYSYTTYVSDPAKPVPYTEDVHFGRTKEYMTDDQRFAARRPDVLVFQTEVLDKDLKLAGPVIADLTTIVSSGDADFVVKLIDVFPDDFKYVDSIDGKGDGKDYPMGGYQMLVRGEIMRGKYRKSFEKPERFESGAITEVKFTMPDVAHVFKQGHRLMVQIQSSWFPLVDRNPQRFVNIYTADEGDFVRSTIRIFHSEGDASNIILPVME